MANASRAQSPSDPTELVLWRDLDALQTGTDPGDAFAPSRITLSKEHPLPGPPKIRPEIMMLAGAS